MVGYYLQNVGNVDLKNGTFDANVVLWFKWVGSLDPSASMELTNAVPTETTKTLLITGGNATVRGDNYQAMYVHGTFTSPLDPHHYPFDQQRLTISLEEGRYSTGFVRYQLDPASTVDRHFEISGWKVGRTSPGGAARGAGGSGATVSCRTYDTNFGNPDLKTNQFAHLDIALHVERTGWPLRLEVLVPPLLIIGLCLVALRIDPTQLEARLTILVPALIAAVALQIATASNLPLESHASFIDDLYVVSYGVVVAIVLVSSPASGTEQVRGVATAAFGARIEARRPALDRAFPDGSAHTPRPAPLLNAEPLHAHFLRSGMPYSSEADRPSWRCHNRARNGWRL